MRNLILLLLMAGPLSLMAQTNRGPRGLDDVSNRKTPSTNTVKKNSEEEDDSKKRSSDASYSNTITLSYGHLARGIAVLTYERNFTERFGLGASLGYCFMPDQTLSMYNSKQNNSQNRDYFTLEDYLNNGRVTPGFNYYFDISGKINSNTNFAYVWGSEMEYRFFGAISVRRYLNKMDLQDFLYAPESTPVNLTYTGALVKIGQTVYRMNGITNEYYIGIGTLNTKIPSIATDYRYSATSPKIQYKNENNLLVVVGGQIGFSF